MSDAETSKAVRRLRELLKDGPQRMTQDQIAELVGVEQQTVSQWATGLHTPRSARVLAALQTKLGIAVTDWLTGEDLRSAQGKRSVSIANRRSRVRAAG
jgi:transcriptional regulator with XRE-family HTH domain